MALIVSQEAGTAAKNLKDQKFDLYGKNPSSRQLPGKMFKSKSKQSEVMFQSTPKALDTSETSRLSSCEISLRADSLFFTNFVNAKQQLPSNFQTP